MLAAACEQATSADDAPANVWGGQHVEMEVTPGGAHLDFDCATGTISEPVPVDAKGPFRLKGTFTPEHGGPTRDGEPSTTVAATYSGTIDEGAMSLQIAAADTDVQDFALVRARHGRVFKCR